MAMSSVMQDIPLEHPSGGLGRRKRNDEADDSEKEKETKSEEWDEYASGNSEGTSAKGKAARRGPTAAIFGFSGTWQRLYVLVFYTLVDAMLFEMKALALFGLLPRFLKIRTCFSPYRKSSCPSFTTKSTFLPVWNCPQRTL